MNIQWLRSQIGLVSQEPILFNTTILENIQLGQVNNGDVKKGDVVNAATLANIHDRIECFPNVCFEAIFLYFKNVTRNIHFKKYDTIVGEKGIQVSGGERQRIAIGKKFLKIPRRHFYFFVQLESKRAYKKS